MHVWNTTERARKGFFKALIGAAGVSVITILGWFVATHINLMITNQEQTTMITDHEGSIGAQWRIISKLQESNSKLSTQVGILTNIQREVIIPTLRENHIDSIHYETPALPPLLMIPEIELKAPPAIVVDHIDSEEFSKEQIQIERRRKD